MISLSLSLSLSAFPRGAVAELIEGFAYPNETLTAPIGSSYLWSVAGQSRATNRTFVPTIYDIGETVTCLVGAATYTTTVWHPRDIASVRGFWWAAKNTFNIVGNGYTDENRPINISGFPILVGIYGETSPYNASRVGSRNEKPYYYGGTFTSPDGRPQTEVFWDNLNLRWVLFYQEPTDDSFENFDTREYYGVGNTQYPWQATWSPGTITPVATTVNVLATDGQLVPRWTDIISNVSVNAAGSNIALKEDTDMGSPSLKFDSTDFYTTDDISVYNDRRWLYLFAGAKDSNPTGGDSTHTVASLNRNHVTPRIDLTTRILENTFTRNRFGATSITNGVPAQRYISFTPSNSDYNVLVNESLFFNKKHALRINGIERASGSLNNNTTSGPSSPTEGFFIGAGTGFLLGAGLTQANFNGDITAIILAANINETDLMSAVDRSRIERFIGLLGGLNIAYDGIGAPRVGSDNPANASEPDATAWVLMDGPWYNTPGDPNSGFVGGQSWRKMSPIGYFPFGKETYVYGDETVRYENGVWLYENATLGEIARAYSTEAYPWLATWNNGFSGAKITPTYNKTTNWPTVP